MNPDILAQLDTSCKKVLFLYDLHEKRFVFVSRAVEQVWELPREAVLAQPELLLASIHPDDREPLFLRLSKLLTGETADAEIKLTVLTADKAEKLVKMEAYPVLGDAGTIRAVAGAAADITEEEQYKSYLAEFAHRKNAVLELIAHDLRNPLVHFRNVAQLLEKEHKEQNYSDLSTYISIIYSSYEECSKLINNLLNDEHLRSPAIYVKKERNNIVKLVQKVVATYASSGVTALSYELQVEKKKMMVEVDEVKFMQIMNNLISNSIKFTEAGGKINISLRREGRNLLITYADTGIGIPEELQPYIFVRYSKASRSGLKGEKSTGVGLSIVRDLVEIQGGSIWFDSVEGRGTTFYITFPL